MMLLSEMSIFQGNLVSAAGMLYAEPICSLLSVCISCMLAVHRCPTEIKGGLGDIQSTTDDTKINSH